MSTIASVGNGISGVVIGAYIGAVIYQSVASSGGITQTTTGILSQGSGSNLAQLIKLVEGDYGYLEFLIAAGVLKVLYDIPQMHDIVLAFVVIAFIGLLITKGPGSSILTYLQSFGSGKIGLFGESTTPNASSNVIPIPVKSAAGAIIA